MTKCSHSRIKQLKGHINDSLSQERQRNLPTFSLISLISFSLSPSPVPPSSLSLSLVRSVFLAHTHTLYLFVHLNISIVPGKYSPIKRNELAGQIKYAIFQRCTKKNHFFQFHHLTFVESVPLYSRFRVLSLHLY